MGRFLTVLAAIILLSSAASQAQQQGTFGDIHGTVTDSSGGVVANATVKITDTETGVSRVARTTPAGSYQVSGLTASIYEITATYSGFLRTHITGIHLDTGQSLTRNLELKAAASIIEVPSSVFVGFSDRSIWERGVFIAGGPGISSTLNTEAAIVGVRLGKVLTEGHLSGWRRGELEILGEAMPVYELFTPSRETYGANFKPAILRWDFVRNGRLIPYANLASGILLTTPSEAGAESMHVTFAPSAGGGVHWFRQGRSIDFGWDLTHIPNAAFGVPKAGGFSFVFSIGYSWFKRSTIVLIQKAEPSPDFAARRPDLDRITY